ncbi:cation:proton antiporter [Paenibacillus apiarius]|uniref:cation:proton antiporter domain-containing protein n=1 Tax=Paenibacillus apiarius TaxID=46240 RepID=UPI003B3B8346
MHHSLISLVIVLFVAFLTPIALHRLKLTLVPVVVAEIVMGLIIGKSGFDIVHPDQWLSMLSTLGFIFLMFLSGLEIDFAAFAGNKKRERLDNGNTAPHPLAVSFLIFVFIFILSIVLSYLFVWAGFISNVFLMTLIISTISLGVVVPTLKDAHIMKTNIGQIILLVAVIADLVTMVLLAVFGALYGEGGPNSWLLLLLFGAGVLLFFVGKRFKNRSFLESMSTGTVQIGIRAVFTLMMVLVALSETVGAENILGAFLAGVLVSLLSPNHDLVQKLDSFGYGFFIPILFVMVGVEMDLWGLFGDWSIFILIPLLFAALLISKVLPAALLKRWYDFKTALAAGFLLTSTLSLVIAAAKIGERLDIINGRMSGALILVAVIASIISPIGFKKLFPGVRQEEARKKIAFVGANQMTLLAMRDLNANLYEASLYRTAEETEELAEMNEHASSLASISNISGYTPEALERAGMLDAAIVVMATGEERRNAELAVWAQSAGVERIIAAVASPKLEESLRHRDIDVFSALFSAKTLLQALIESPGVIRILSNQETSLYQIDLNNRKYDGMRIRSFPFTGDVIFVRLFRDQDSIVPHGDTTLKLGDRLIMTGSVEYMEELKRELEYSV